MRHYNRLLQLMCAVLLPVFLGSAAMAVDESSADSVARWEIKPFLSIGYVGARAESSDAGRTAELDVDARLSPGVIASYAVTRQWTVEASVSYDFYQAEVNRSDKGEGSDFSSATFALGDLWNFKDLTIWGMRPFVAGDVSYRYIFADLAAPAENYNPAWGLDGSIGATWNQWEVRLGYSWRRHSVGSKKSGTIGADELDLSEFFLQGGWKFGL